MQTSTTDSKKTEILELEIASLSILIGRRNEWLNNPLNRMKGTYSAVASDTAKQLAELEEKEKELKELKEVTLNS